MVGLDYGNKSTVMFLSMVQFVDKDTALWHLWFSGTSKSANPFTLIVLIHYNELIFQRHWEKRHHVVTSLQMLHMFIYIQGTFPFPFNIIEILKFFYWYGWDSEASKACLTHSEAGTDIHITQTLLKIKYWLPTQHLTLEVHPTTPQKIYTTQKTSLH